MSRYTPLRSSIDSKAAIIVRNDDTSDQTPWLPVTVASFEQAQQLCRVLNQEASRCLPTTPGVAIMGYSRHGKGTVCQFLRRQTGLSSISSSKFAAPLILDALNKELGGRYSSVDEAYKDRHAHKQLWFRLISEYNTPDKARLAREVLKAYRIYDGIRNREEFDACRDENLFRLTVWVDATERLGNVENKDSCTVCPDDADIVLLNNGGTADLWCKVQRLAAVIEYLTQNRPVR